MQSCSTASFAAQAAACCALAEPSTAATITGSVGFTCVSATSSPFGSASHRDACQQSYP
ncbi:Uncharacterised protein [Mycobacteroides abscessus subsp. abscessus]|nr:Uncharacterised protein [Mycobacteroides abscessus subsp. abscessus]